MNKGGNLSLIHIFSDGSVENAISLDNQLNIRQVADLVLPDKDTTFEAVSYTHLPA